MIEKSLCELIIREYYDMVYYFCFANLNRNRQAAEDCTQETFLILFSKRNKLEYTDNIKHWLYKTAQKVMKAYLRKNKQIMLDIDDVADELVIEEETFKDADDVFDCLTEEEQELLNIYYNYDYGDRIRLAEEKGMTQSALYNKVYRIRQKLSKEHNK